MKLNIEQVNLQQTLELDNILKKDTYSDFSKEYYVSPEFHVLC